ncbi:MAG: hypothetical protein K9N07_09770 [Candidatus Cloacimonetes bacterium]|nr:hypothetical protein [Candidatus Cloacimonadota bacterium]
MKVANCMLFCLLFAIITSCKKDPISPVPSNPTQETEETTYYLSFKVTCSESGTYHPVLCDAEIFKNEAMMEHGGNTVNGWYASMIPYYKIYDNARIKLKDIASGEILMEVWNINPSANPEYFVINSSDKMKNEPTDYGLGHLHIGSCK